MNKFSVEDLFTQLLQKHYNLLRKKNNQSLSIREAEIFLEEIRSAGQNIEDLDQRQLIQSYAGFWGLFVYEKNNQFPLTLIKDFEKEEKDYKKLEFPIQNFFGRQEELSCLIHWITKENCHLIAILGIGGIGKTTLALQLIERIKNEFEYVFSISLVTAPYAENICNDLIQSMYGSSTSPKDIDEKISLILNYFRNHRCLLLLDNLETVLENDQRINSNLYEQRYSGYRKLINQVTQFKHQSCLLLTSREETSELKQLKENIKLVRTLTLKGLAVNEAINIFKSKGLSVLTSDLNFQEIVNYYQGNPLALKIVSAEIKKDKYGCDLTKFLQCIEKNSVVGDIYNLLESQLRLLSKREQSLIYWLAINREPVCVNDLKEDVELEDLSEVLELLVSKHLVEIQKDEVELQEKFSLQNVIWEYVIQDFCNQIAKEINDVKVNFINSHALIKAQSKENIRDIQSRKIIVPILDKLRDNQDSNNIVEIKLERIFLNWRTADFSKSGYFAGNILNILCHLKRTSNNDINLSRFDFSYLTIWQANLQDVDLAGLNLSHSHVKNCIFTETFGSVLSVAISPDGQWLAAGDNAVRLWKIIDGKQIHLFGEHKNWVWTVTFSPDGKILASGSEDQTIILWDTETGNLIKSLESVSWIKSIVFSPDGKILASGSDDQSIKLWDIHTGECICTLMGHSQSVNSVSFSPDGKILASGSDDQSIKFWNIHTGECIDTLMGHSQSVNSVSFSPNGKILASGSDDQSIKIWNAHIGECIYTLEEHSKLVNSVSFSPDGKILASGSDDQSIKLWNVHTGECIDTLMGHRNWVWELVFSPDGQVLASCSEDQTVKVWDVRNRNTLYTLQGYNNWIFSIDFHPDGQKIASGNEDKKVRIWDIDSEKCIQTLSGHNNRVRSVIFSPNEKILASGSEDRTVKLWNIETGECLRTMEEHESSVKTLVFNLDGKILASGSDDKTIKTWDVATGICLNTFIGHQQRVWSIAFSPDGKILASGSDDKTIKIWDVATGKCLNTFTGHENWVRAIAFSHNGHKISSGSDDKTIKIWDVATGICLKTFTGHDNCIRAVTFHQNDNVLASGGADKIIKIWDVNTGKCLKHLIGHDSWIRSVRFSPNDNILASSSADETIRFWDIETGKEVRLPLSSPKPYEGMNITKINGLTPANIATLNNLGATEDI
jgi:WD40 repeat protein